jgi:hypothetical protein
LTASGIAFVYQRLLGSTKQEKGHEAINETAPVHSGNRLLPFWDIDARQLWLGKRLLKEFRQPAPHQTGLLDGLQKQGWGSFHIRDPLPGENGESEEDAKRRLQATVKNLNRNLPRGTIRFRGDGTGHGVRWEYDCPHRRKT